MFLTIVKIVFQNQYFQIGYFEEDSWGYRLKRLSPKFIERMVSKMMRSYEE
jgi:hypothetical protein